MADVVVLGAGLGGTLMAYELVPQLRDGDTLTLISEGKHYHFVPSNPWVAVGWRARKDIEVDLEGVMRRKGIRLLPQGAERVFPHENRMATARRQLGALRLPGDRHRPRPGVRRDRGIRAGGAHAVDLPHRPCRAGVAGVRGILQESGADRDRRGTGGVVLRAGLRVRLYPRHASSAGGSCATGCR